MRQLIVALMFLSLSACTGVGGKLTQLQNKKPGQDNFAQALASEYLGYAQSLSEAGHPIKSNYFAGKGLSALDGGVEPEESKALADKRQSLVAALTSDVEEIAPAKAAHAQLIFDCAANGERICLDSLDGAMADVQFIADQLVHGGDNQFTVPFAKGSANVSDQAQTIVNIVAKRVKGYGKYKVQIVSYSAAHRSTARMKALDNLRVLAIEKGLIKAGVDAGNIRSHTKRQANEVALSTDEKRVDANSVMVVLQTFDQAAEATPP